MKNAKYAIIAIALVCAICAGFYFVSKGQQTNEKQLTDIEKVLLNHKVYWFKEVKEFEEYYDIISFEDSDYIFIIIG